jgi:hypothetical protein
VRSVFIASVFVLLTQSAFAQEQPQPHDYSRDALLHFVAENKIQMSPLPDHLPPGRIQWHIGWLEFHGLGMEWRIFYLPLAIPLAGSGLRNVATVPNPLELTGTAVATGPDLMRERSASVNREIKKVLKLQRQAMKQ